MRKKIEVGDYVYIRPPFGPLVIHVDKVSDRGSEVYGFGGWWSVSRCARLPASPAVLARSHRLLMRLAKTSHALNERGETEDLDRWNAACVALDEMGRRIGRRKGKA